MVMTTSASSKPGHRVVARLQPDGPERRLVVVVDDALAHEGLGDGDARRPAELAQRGCGAGAHDAVAGQGDRVDRVADRVGGLEQLAGAGLGLDRAPPRQRLGLELGGHDVLGQLQVGGAGLLGLGHLERLADDLGDDLRAGDARVPLRDRPEELDEVDELVGLLVHPLEVGLARQRDERRAVEVGVADRGNEVHRAGAEGAQADAGPAGETAVHVGHVGAALLVAHGDERDRRVGQRLVEVERLLARDAEHVLDTLCFQALHEDIRCATCLHPDLLGS